jgi:nitrogen fixation protein NifU and related proteins
MPTKKKFFSAFKKMFLRRIIGKSIVEQPRAVNVGMLSVLGGWGGVAQRQRRNYDEKVIDHYENPRNVGSFDKGTENVGTGLVGAPACGDVMKLQVKVNPETRVVEETVFKTFGCGSAIASSSLATEWIKGKTVEEALAIKNTEIAKHLSLPPVKLHCSMLAEDAIKAAIGDWQKQQNAKQ